MGKSSSDFCRTDIGRAGRVRWPIGRRGLPVTGPRALLMQLSQRTSAKGNAYLAGWLGKASVVAFLAEEPDKWGNPVWDVFVSTPEPRAEAVQDRDPARRAGARGEAKSANFAGSASGNAPAKASARPQERGDGWRGSRSTAGPRTAPAGPCGRRRPVL